MKKVSLQAALFYISFVLLIVYFFLSLFGYNDLSVALGIKSTPNIILFITIVLVWYNDRKYNRLMIAVNAFYAVGFAFIWYLSRIDEVLLTMRTGCIVAITGLLCFESGFGGYDEI